MGFSNRWALIVGGGSRIGQAVGTLLAEADTSVTLVGYRQEKLDAARTAFLSPQRGSTFVARIRAMAGYGLVTGFLLLALAVPAGAQVGSLLPVGVRIVGYVNAAPDGVRPDYTWHLNLKGQTYKLLITKLTVFEGGALPGDIDAALSPFQYQLMLAGDRVNLDRFLSTAPKEQVIVYAYLHLAAGARTFMLARVEPAPTPSPGG